HSARRDGGAAEGRRRPDPPRLRAAWQPAPGDRQRTAPTPAGHDRATPPRRTVGGSRLGDRLLSPARLRTRRTAAQGRAAQKVLGHPGPPDRDLRGAGESPVRLTVCTLTVT